MPAAPIPVVDVAINIVRGPAGHVLLAERTARQVAAGFWELPGGKIETGETAQQAAARELEEEVGIRARSMRPRLLYEHAFRTKRVRLHVFAIDDWSGEPAGREGQRIAWVDPADPSVAPILPSNDRLFAALALPPLWFTPHANGPGDSVTFLTQARTALGAGVRTILVRAPHFAPDQRIALARRAVALASPFGAQVLLAGTPFEAQRAGALGLVSCACELGRLQARPQTPLWIATCATSEDLERAIVLGADAAIASPVLPSSSPVASSAVHSETEAIGWDGLRRLAQASPIPVYAEGGLSAEMVSQAQRAGAAGVLTGDL
jgi:8-oxo-dGTP diphosphatase